MAGLVATVVVATGALLAVPDTASAATVSEIKLAQTDLNGLDYDAGAVDGIAGPQTANATGAFQSDQCLTVDGVIGPETLGGLDKIVKAVQTAAGITADGTYADTTTEAVKGYQAAHGLTASGVADADTMKSMGIERVVASCHATDELRQKIVSVAAGEIGTRADGSNCVPGKPYSICADWCAAFATWVWRTAGEGIPFMTYVPNVYDWAVDHGRWYGTSRLKEALPGDLIIFGTATNRYHIGVVESVDGSTVHVISGNTRNPSNSSQVGVYNKSYTLSSSTFYGLVRP